jgi:hypothetical protein
MEHFTQHPDQVYLAVRAIMTGAHYFNTQLDQTVGELQRTQATIESLQGTVANLEGEAHTRHHTISQLQKPAEAPAAPEYPAPTPSLSHQLICAMAMSESIPDPEKYNSNCSQLRSFLGQLRMKLITNHDQFPDEQSQIIYALSLLDQAMVLMVAPLLDTGVLPSEEIDDLITLLEALYADPDHQGTAKSELDNSRQANREFVAYYADF